MWAQVSDVCGVSTNYWLLSYTGECVKYHSRCSIFINMGWDLRLSSNISKYYSSRVSQQNNNAHFRLQ